MCYGFQSADDNIMQEGVRIRGYGSMRREEEGWHDLVQREKKVDVYIFVMYSLLRNLNIVRGENNMH